MKVLRWFLLANAVVWNMAIAHAGEPGQAWRLEGFSNPESVLVGASGQVMLVSNMDGAPTEKNGTGFISKATLDGQMLALKWVTGLNAPKGMAMVGDKLFVADIDELVVINAKYSAIIKRYPAKGAKFLNDVAVDQQGRIYVSDMVENTIWRLDGGKFEPWLRSADLKSPNGLIVKGDDLIVACWGVMTNGFATDVPGHLLKVSLADKSIANLGSGASIGNLDGLQVLSAMEFLATDWMVGKVLKITEAGTATTLFDVNPGSADLGYSAALNTVFVPMMKDGAVVAYSLSAH